MTQERHEYARDRSRSAATYWALIITTCLVASCNGPLPFMSGGTLDGSVQPAPRLWELPDDFGVVQLETRPEEPYSVNIAYTQINGALYINAGDTETEWVKHMESDPRVRLRREGVIYVARAIRVTQDEEITRFGAAWTAESMFHRDPAELDVVWIYRLVPPAETGAIESTH